MVNEIPDKMIKRRKFIEGMTALGVATTVVPLSSCGQETSADVQTTVYRFQTRKARTCNACKKHQHYKVFLSQEAANQNRAHPGCNCRIVEQQISEEYSTSITPSEQNGVIDLRSVFGYV